LKISNSKSEISNSRAKFLTSVAKDSLVGTKERAGKAFAYHEKERLDAGGAAFTSPGGIGGLHVIMRLPWDLCRGQKNSIRIKAKPSLNLLNNIEAVLKLWLYNFTA
jgi:hypothetical protein